MKRSTLVALLTVIAAVANLAVAGSPAAAQSYAGVRGSVFLPNTTEEGLQEFDTGFGGEAFAGYRFGPNLALEAGAGYYESRWEDEEDIITEKDTVSNLPVTLTALAVLPLEGQARVYAGAGVGAHFARAKVEGSWKEVGLDIAASDSSTDTAFGYHVVVGGEYLLAPRVGLELQARWFRAEPRFSFFEDTASRTEVTPDIGGILISLGLVFQL